MHEFQKKNQQITTETKLGKGMHWMRAKELNIFKLQLCGNELYLMGIKE